VCRASRSPRRFSDKWVTGASEGRRAGGRKKIRGEGRARKDPLTLVRYPCTYNKALSSARLCAISFVFLLSRSYVTRMRRRKLFSCRLDRSCFFAERSSLASVKLAESKRISQLVRYHAASNAIRRSRSLPRFEKLRITRKSRYADLSRC